MPQKEFTDARPDVQHYVPGRFDARQLNGAKPLWHRQPKESIQAYEAFMTYLTLPGEERTMRNTAKQLGKSYGLMTKWSQQWQWGARVASYEEYYLLLRLDSFEADRDQMWRDQKALADMGMEIVGSHFQKLIQAIGADGTADVVKPDALVRLFDTVTKVQRMAILGRVQSAEQAAERNERLAEQYSDELVELIREVQGVVGLNKEQEEKLNEVLMHHLTGAGT